MMGIVAATVEQRRQHRRSLYEGGRLRCPRDKILRDILAYRVFEVSEEFAHELNVIMRCPCGHIFSPALTTDEIEATGV